MGSRKGNIPLNLPKISKIVVTLQCLPPPPPIYIYIFKILSCIFEVGQNLLFNFCNYLILLFYVKFVILGAFNVFLG